MTSVKKYIESGILESYVLGITDPQESADVEHMAANYDEIRAEISMIAESLEKYAEGHAIEPSITMKPFVLAFIDYTERIKDGEPVTTPPILHEGSSISDYVDWLKARAAVLPDDIKNLHARIIGYTPEIVTAIVWIKEFSPWETHTNEFEKFLIIEGSCDITIGEQVHQLAAGRFSTDSFIYETHGKSNFPYPLQGNFATNRCLKIFSFGHL